MIKLIDKFLNRITMYRLTLYYLICLLAIASGFGFLGLISFKGLEIIYSTLFLVVVGLVANKIFAWAFEAPVNFESVYITALILALIISPTLTLHNYAFLFWAMVLAVAAKFILAIGRKHIFNPAAAAVVITAFAINQSAVWWVGNVWMFVPVVLGGYLIVRKIQREDMVFIFLATAVGFTLIYGIIQGSNVMTLMKDELIYSPLFFFATIMLTEPLTTPPTKFLQVLYGGLVGFLIAPQTHFGGLYFTPELALVTGNIFSYIVSPKQKLALKLTEKVQLSPDVYDFVFALAKPIKYRPGQYMEWTLGHSADSRGNRRYFTLSSSPTEKELRMGVKFYEPSSSFKKNLLAMRRGDSIVVGQLAGDFTLPKNPMEYSIFIAGGIGITPFRSMLKYLIDRNEKRNITLFFSNRTVDEIVYEDVFLEAYEKLGIRTIYTITDEAPAEWKGERGRIDEKMIAKYVPGYRAHTFYISGTHAMVTSMHDMLAKSVPKKQIKTDFFPGFV